MPDTFSNTHGTFTKLAIHSATKIKKLKNSINIEIRNYSGFPVVRTLHFHGQRGLGSILQKLISYKLSCGSQKKLLQAEHISAIKL